MKAINGIESKDIVAIDIETARIENNFLDLSEEYQSAWEYKNKNNGAIPTQEELSDIWIETASLYPEFSKVISVSLAYLDKDKLRCKQYTSNDEFLILEELSKDLISLKKYNPSLRLVGHSSKFFDFPFLCKRYIINSMDIPSILDESNAKPWEQTLLCTNELWKSFGAFNNHGSSLQALCVALRIPTSKVDLVGDEVGKSYFNGELNRISDYCCLDTIATFNIFRRFKKESIFLEDDIIYVNKDEILKIENRIKKVKTPIITEVFDKGYISESAFKKIKEISSDFNSNEKENLILILRACLKDKPTSTEIEFLNSL